MPTVIKNDGRREPYDREKVLSGIIKATQKRPISTAQINLVVDSVEKIIVEHDQREIPSRMIGDIVIEQLKAIDTVAYVRFASVYKTFKDIDEFFSDLKQ